MRRSWRLLLMAVVMSPSVIAQEGVRRLPPADSNAVVVDVVVRDGRGRPITDLVVADFDVLEDGVLQALGQFAAPKATAVPREAAVQDAPSEPVATVPGGAGTLGGRDTIAFVFERLSTEGRVAATKAVRRHLEGRTAPILAGVFSIETVLVVLQDFTLEKAPLLAALDEVETRAAHAGDTQIAQAKGDTRARVAADRAVARLASIPRPSNAAEGVARAQAQIAAAHASMGQAIDDAFTSMARDEHGFTTAHALTAIVDALRSVPGRKAVVLFSEALFRTEATENRFLSVIHAANRASVSVYPVEAAGLSGTSYESLTAAEVNSAANVSLARQQAGEDLGGGAYSRGLEHVTDATKFNPRASLQWIADSTGGTFVRDTNDLEGGLTRIGSDLRSYYLLGYTPRNEQFDGRFRKIAVRVKRKGVDVRARSGYFAVRSSGPVLAHVAPALAVIESGRRPKDVSVFAGATAFPDGEGAARASVVVTVPGPEVARLAKRDKGRLDVTLLARVLGTDGKPVDAMSRRFVVEREAKAADLLLLRDTWLAPGRYTLEAIAFDAAGGQSGTTRADFQVAEGARPLDGAQVVIVKGALPMAEAPVELEVGHPLRFGDVVLQPLSGEPIAGNPPRPFIVQVTAPSAAGAAALAVTVEVFRGEKSLATSGVLWSAPEPGGLRRHVAEVPIGALPAGAYELRASLSDGRAQRLIRIPFTVAP